MRFFPSYFLPTEFCSEWFLQFCYAFLSFCAQETCEEQRRDSVFTLWWGWGPVWSWHCEPAVNSANKLVCFFSPRCFKGVASCIWWEAICSHGRGESWILLLHSSFHYKEWSGSIWRGSLLLCALGLSRTYDYSHLRLFDRRSCFQLLFKLPFYFGYISVWGFCHIWTSGGESLAKTVQLFLRSNH